MQHRWLEPGAGWCIHLSVPVSDFRADAHLVSGTDDRREVVYRVLRLARNHLVERFGDDPFDGDELVLRDDHMVEHEVAWAVPFVRRSILDHPTLHNVLFVGPGSSPRKPDSPRR